MKTSGKFEFPPELVPVFKKAKKLEVFTLVYTISAIAFMYAVLGSSQAMKTAWIEDILGIIPPVAFLIAARVYHKIPNEVHPYGYHRIVTISFLIGSAALFSMGTFLLMDSISTLISVEHPTIGSIEIFGYQFWQGWAMIAALLYSSIPAIILGKIKIPIGNKLHDKILYNDSKMNFANWKSGAAAIVGIIGISFGFWWFDAAAAIIISTDILYDGFSNLKTSIMDLMDRIPTNVEGNRRDPIITKVKNLIEAEDWIDECELRIREEGHVYFGDAVIVCSDERQLTERIKNLTEKVHKINWRIYDIVIMPVKEIKKD